MGNLLFTGNIYVFIVTMIAFAATAICGHLYLIKYKKSKRFDKISSILNIILSVILFLIIAFNFEFNNGEVIEDENILQNDTAVVVNTPMLPDELRILESNKRLEKMLDEK